jgi:hypothetical protein
MITHVEKDNLFNMLYSQSGVMKYRDVTYEYAMSYGGVQRITFRGEEKKVDFEQTDHVSRKVLKFNGGLEHIQRNLKYLSYEGYLEDNFRQFEEEIESNMYEIITQTNKIEYITNIYNKLSQLVYHESSELENIWKHKPQKEKLAQTFIDYIRSRNLDFDKIDEYEVSCCSFYFQTEPLKKLEFDKLTKDEKKEIYNFHDYYSYDGHYDMRINVLEINIKTTKGFIENFLKTNYLKYIDSKEISQTKIEIFQIEPTHSFKYNSRSQQEQIANILAKLKLNESGVFFINEKVKQNDFKKLFTYFDLTKVNPVYWQKSIASLRYFIKKFPLKLSNEMLFKTAYYCFDYEDKKDYTQIANAKQISVKDKETIDYIFKLYPLSK